MDMLPFDERMGDDIVSSRHSLGASVAPSPEVRIEA
jgi:hypothetical protein